MQILARPCFALSGQCYAFRCFAFPFHCPSLLCSPCHAFTCQRSSIQSISFPCLTYSCLFCAQPFLFYTSLFVSIAIHIVALPFHFFSSLIRASQNLAFPFRFSTQPCISLTKLGYSFPYLFYPLPRHFKAFLCFSIAHQSSQSSTLPLQSLSLGIQDIQLLYCSAF